MGIYSTHATCRPDPRSSHPLSLNSSIAIDAGICTHSEAELQAIVNTFTKVYESMDLALNIHKTEFTVKSCLVSITKGLEYKNKEL